jgi:hypothetical protein
MHFKGNISVRKCNKIRPPSRSQLVIIPPMKARKHLLFVTISFHGPVNESQLFLFDRFVIKAFPNFGYPLKCRRLFAKVLGKKEIYTFK